MAHLIPRRFFVFSLFALVLTSLIGCGGGGGSHNSETFVGRIDGTQLSLGAVTDGNTVTFYICDGHNARRFDASLRDGSYTTEIDSLGSITLTAADNEVTGVLTAGGTQYPFSATKATGKAALMNATGQQNGTPISAGWVIFPDGSESGGVVKGITDGSSNLTIHSATIPYIEQDNIIAILIGIRSPIVKAP